MSERKLNHNVSIENIAQILSPTAKSFVDTVVSMEQRQEFFSDPRCVDVLTNKQLLEQKESWQELRLLGRLDYPALAIQTYLDVQADRQFREWVGKSKGTLKNTAWQDLLIKGENFVSGVYDFLHCENKGQFMANFEVDALVAIDSFNPFGDLKFLELASRFKKKGKDTPWHERVAYFTEYMESLGIKPIEDQDINATILARYKDKLPENWEQLPYSQKMYVLSSIRASLPRSDMEKYRAFINTYSKSPLGSDYLSRIQETEDPAHPLAHLKITLGWEREHKIPPQFSAATFRKLELMGFKKGGLSGHMTEDSPGPFLSSFTSRRIYLMYQKYGLADAYSRYRESIHLNIGFQRNDQLTVFLRWLQATGYAYEPVMDSSSEVDNDTDIYLENHGQGNYFEFKAFNAATASGNARFFKRSASIAMALHCYHKFTDVSESLTQEEMSLASIWIKYQNLLYRGFSQLGIMKIFNEQAEEHMVTFAKAIREVLPDHWSRYNVNSSALPMGKKFIVVNNRTYPNIVSFARLLLIDAHKEVQEAFVDGMKEFKQGLSYLTQQADIAELSDYAAMVNKFFERFPCGLNYYSSFEDKIKLLSELKGKYLSEKQTRYSLP